MPYVDVYALVGFFLMIFPVIAMYFVAVSQFDTLKKGVYRVQVLSTRTALMLSAYAFLIWLSLLAPEIAPIMEFPIAIAEGFAFYSFFAMLVSNLGGSDNTVHEMVVAGREACCCCPESKVVYYNKVSRALFQFLYIRPVVILLAAIFEYADVKVLYLIFTLVGFGQFIYGFGSLVFFYEHVYQISGNVNGTLKIFLVKVSIGLYVVQGIIEDLLIASDAIDVRATDRYSSEERAQRALALAMLIEYCIMSALLYVGFGSDITPNTATHTAVAADAYQKADKTWGSFLADVFRFQDVFSGLALSDHITDDQKASVANPLSQHNKA